LRVAFICDLFGLGLDLKNVAGEANGLFLAPMELFTGESLWHTRMVPRVGAD
jgi:hypothetical protein